MKAFWAKPIFRSSWAIPIMWIITKWLRLGTRYQIWKLKRTIKKFGEAALEAEAAAKEFGDTIRKDVLSSPGFTEEDDE